LGTVQVIKPGDINWMTAGRGIVHSERTPPEDRNPADRNVAHGIQVWVGLPKKFEECEPSFAHWDKESLPTTNLADGLTAKVMIGRHGPISSPVKTLSPTLFMDFVCTHDTEKSLEFSEKEVGFYLVSGQATVNGEIIRENTLAFLDSPGTVLFKINNNSRVIVVGGEPFPERRFMWWNFVSSSRDRIDQASEAWKNQTMGKVPGEKECAPLPDDPDA
jgi:redox-sensitive bicupin YhaK (pirin superfamily)